MLAYRLELPQGRHFFSHEPRRHCGMAPLRAFSVWRSGRTENLISRKQSWRGRVCAGEKPVCKCRVSRPLNTKLRKKTVSECRCQNSLRKEFPEGPEIFESLWTQLGQRASLSSRLGSSSLAGSPSILTCAPSDHSYLLCYLYRTPM